MNNGYEYNSKILDNYLMQDDKISSENIIRNILSYYYTEIQVEKLEFKNTHLYVSLFKNVYGILQNNSIIFGIDDNKIDISSQVYRFKKVSRIMEMNTIEENKSPLIKIILDKSVNRVVFYGYSLSDADYGYFQFVLVNIQKIKI